MPHTLPLTSFTRLVFAMQLLSTLAMFGLIWFVQLVHYPLFLRIAPENFPFYERHHATRTGWIAAPLMSAELLTSFCLLFPALRPPQVSPAAAWLGLALVLLLWVSTVFLQIPLHNQLHERHNPATIRRLINTNWLRTVAWTLRAALVVWWATAPR